LTDYKWAEAFAFNAFFSLFPLMILLVTIVSSSVDRDRVGKEVISYMESYVPISVEMQHLIIKGIPGVINSREQAGAIAFLNLVSAALQCLPPLSLQPTVPGAPRCTIVGVRR